MLTHAWLCRKSKGGGGLILIMPMPTPPRMDLGCSERQNASLHAAQNILYSLYQVSPACMFSTRVCVKSRCTWNRMNGHNGIKRGKMSVVYPKNRVQPGSKPESPGSRALEAGAGPGPWYGFGRLKAQLRDSASPSQAHPRHFGSNSQSINRFAIAVMVQGGSGLVSGAFCGVRRRLNISGALAAGSVAVARSHLLCGPVGPAPGFDRARLCDLGVDRRARECTLQAPGSLGTSELLRVRCAPSADFALVLPLLCLPLLWVHQAAAYSLSRCTLLDQAAAPEERDVRALDRHSFGAQAIWLLVYKLGTLGACVWLRGSSCPRMRASACSPLAGSCGGLCLGMPLAAPLSLQELGRVRVGPAQRVLLYGPLRRQCAGQRRLQVSATVLPCGNVRLRMADRGTLQACLLQGGTVAQKTVPMFGHFMMFGV
ncbi:hypothetical protein BC826DRAFT_974417 [Russula brevipes]|nr:hypothetical protein BC826DRAFT_974417 [Russula brevipes]